jgi:predicted permease
VRFATRLFRRQPGLVAVTVGGVALAVAVSTAVFSIVNALAYRGYGIADDHEVFRVESTRNTRRASFAYSYSTYTTLRGAATSIDLAAANWGYSGFGTYTETPPSRGDRGRPLRGVPVSGNYHQVLGARSVLGRTLGDADDSRGAQGVVVLAEEFWRHAFHGDSSIIGRTLWISGRPTVVAGVVAAGFTGPIEVGGLAPDAWMTFTAVWEAARMRQAAQAEAAQTRIDAMVAAGRSMADPDRLAILEVNARAAPQSLEGANVVVLGRLRPGVSREIATSEIAALTERLYAALPQGAQTPRVELAPIGAVRDATVLGVSRGPLLWAIAFLVLLACANVANVMLASVTGRVEEIATRTAIGATHWRLVRQLLTESVLMGLAGGLIGWIGAVWLAAPLAMWLGLRPGIDVSPDLRVVAFAALSTIGVSVLAGLAPRRRTRIDQMSALRSGRSGPGRLRSLLIGSQAATSVVLLVLAVLVTRGLVQAVRIDRGYDVDRLLAVKVGFSRGHLAEASRMQAYWASALERVRALPGVTAVTLGSNVPFDGTTAPERLPSSRIVNRTDVDSNYFETIGARFVRGRAFTDEEVRRGAPVAIVSERLAREHWGDADPIGATLAQVWGDAVKPGAATTGVFRKPPGTRVVGVVREVIDGLQGFDWPTIYLPMSPGDLRGASLVIRGDRDLETPAETARRALVDLDPDVEIADVRLATDDVTRELRYPAAVVFLATLLATTALGLSVAGLFGVTAFSVTERRREIGVRMALGATRHAVVRQFVRSSLTPVTIGLMCGVAGAFFAGRLVHATLYGVSDRDPVAMFAGVAVLLVAATFASIIPARRAATIDPAEVMKAP